MIALKRKQPMPIGLHLGPRYATAVQLARTGGELEVYAIARGEMPCDENKPIEEQDTEVALALRKLIADHHFKGKQVVSCLGSQELFVQNVRLPQLPDEEIEKVVRWEAEERLPYPVDDAEIRHLMAGQVRQDDNIKQEVILLACHQGVINRHIGILEKAGLIPESIDIEPSAVLRCLRSVAKNEATDQRLAFLVLGEKASTVIFSEGEQILFLKFIPIGGHHLDLAVSQHLQLNLPEASRMRSTVTASAELNSDNEIHRSVIDAIRHPLEQIGLEVELCLRYFKVTFRGKFIDKVIVTGSEASPWLAEYLQQRLDCPCELGNPLEALMQQPTATSTLECPGRWTTAMGLSMQ